MQCAVDSKICICPNRLQRCRQRSAAVTRLEVSIVARDRTVVRRLAVRQIEHHLVDVAPAPAFRRIVALDDRMAGGVEMLGRVLVRRIVAAADMAAGAAEPQMHPCAALQAFLAAERARRHVANAGEMRAALCVIEVTPLGSRQHYIGAAILERRLRRVAEKAVDRRHHLRALADRAADPLDRAGAHVADREHAGHGGFQRGDRPAAIRFALRAGQHEAAAIERDAAAVEPAGRGIGADEQEQVADVEAMFFGRAGCASARARGGVLSAVEPDDLGLGHQLDVRRRLDALDQIARHAGAEAAAADHHVHLARVAREKHRGLAGRIAAADQRDLLAGAQPRLDRRGPVPDAAAFEAVEIFDRRPAVARAAGDHDRLRAQRLAASVRRARRRRRAASSRATWHRPGSGSRRRTSAPG